MKYLLHTPAHCAIIFSQANTHFKRRRVLIFIAATPAACFKRRDFSKLPEIHPYFRYPCALVTLFNGALSFGSTLISSTALEAMAEYNNLAAQQCDCSASAVWLLPRSLSLSLTSVCSPFLTHTLALLLARCLACGYLRRFTSSGLMSFECH